MSPGVGRIVLGGALALSPVGILGVWTGGCGAGGECQSGPARGWVGGIVLSSLVVLVGIALIVSGVRARQT